MEHIFSVYRKPLKCEPPHFERVTDMEVIRPIVTVSSQNIIAFTSATDLHDRDSSTWGGHVYVCDLNTPWDCHKVCSTGEAVSALAWDEEGIQLCIGTEAGLIQAWGPKDQLLDQWQLLYEEHFAGESVLEVIFFSSGRQFIHIDKKIDAPISERVQLVRTPPTCKGFGGAAEAGVFALLASGVCVCVCVCAPGVAGVCVGAPRTHTNTHTRALRPARAAATAAALAHRNGTIQVAWLSPSSLCVRCASCTVTSSGILVKSMPAFYATEPCRISWVQVSGTWQLLACGTNVQLWRLTPAPHVPHKHTTKVSGNTTPGGGPKNLEPFTTLSWVCGGVAAPLGSAALRVCACALVTRTHAHHLHAHTHTVTSVQIPTENMSLGASSPKKAKYGNNTDNSAAIVCGCSLSALDSVMVVIDTRSQLHAFRTRQPWTDPRAPLPLVVQQVTNQLEFALVSGTDCLDVLLTLRAPQLEAIYDRITESFQRHAPSFQQYYFQRWLTLRAAICRMVPSLQSSAASLQTLLLLHGTWASCGGGKLDDSPLATEHDCDKALAAIEAKCEACCEWWGLGGMRRALRRAFDVAATLLAALPHVTPTHPGYELYTDPAAILLLRKLIVLYRSGRTPVSDALQRLPGALTNDFIEECATLALQLSYSSVWENLPRAGLSKPNALSTPHHCEFFCEPEALSYTPERPSYLDNAPTTPVDTIRYTLVGGLGGGAAARYCGRCGAQSAALAPLPAPTAAPTPGNPAVVAPTRAAAPTRLATHHARYAHTCRCGGRWTLSSNS